MDSPLSIDELSAAAGLSRRAVRFYVQQGLLPPPEGLGRGSHYNASHLRRLEQIAELQRTGHSLESIRRILAGQSVEAPKAMPRASRRPAMQSSLWTRLTLGDGIELHFDAAKYSPEAQKLLRLRDVAREAFEASDGTDERED